MTIVPGDRRIAAQERKNRCVLRETVVPFPFFLPQTYNKSVLIRSGHLLGHSGACSKLRLDNDESDHLQQRTVFVGFCSVSVVAPHHQWHAWEMGPIFWLLVCEFVGQKNHAVLPSCPL